MSGPTEQQRAMGPLQLDSRKPNHITIVGRKESGKSVLAHRFWSSWPGDGLVIDPTGDVDAGPDAEPLTDPLPSRWPDQGGGLEDIEGRRKRRSRLRYVPDPGADDYLDNLDRAAGLAFTRGRCLLWVDEVGELTNAHKTPPAMRRILHQSRHRGLSLIFCGPRPVDINTLVLSQADYVAVFDVPNPNDRQRLADTMGLPFGELDDAHRQLVEHGFLWWDARQRELTLLPPLPIRAEARQAREGRRFQRDQDGNAA